MAGRLPGPTKTIHGAERSDTGLMSTIQGKPRVLTSFTAAELTGFSQRQNRLVYGQDMLS